MSERKYTGKDYVSDIIRGMASGLGAETVPMYKALPAGMPEGAGTSPEIFQAMMAGKKKEAASEDQLALLQTKYDLMGDLQAERFKEQASLEAKRAKAKQDYFSYTETLKGGTDPKTRFKYNFLLRMGMNPAFQFGAIDLDDLSKQLDTLYGDLGGLGTGNKKESKAGYKSLADLQKAYDAGTIDANEVRRVAKAKNWNLE